MNWMDRYKVARRLSLLWIAGLISYATFQLFADPSIITAAAVSAFGILTALLAPIFAKYFHDRKTEDNGK